MSPLQAIFDAAKHFGLTDDEVWETIDESLYAAGDEATVSECLDDVTAALAGRILAKHRRASRSAGTGTAARTG
jgi:hypothetical protein